MVRTIYKVEVTVIDQGNEHTADRNGLVIYTGIDVVNYYGAGEINPFFSSNLFRQLVPMMYTYLNCDKVIEFKRESPDGKVEKKYLTLK